MEGGGGWGGRGGRVGWQGRGGGGEEGGGRVGGVEGESKKKQLYALAVNVSAAAKHDPDYIKLKKVMKMRKILRAKLERKYHAEATKRMKIYFKRLSNSNSSTLSKIGKKHSK